MKPTSSLCARALVLLALAGCTPRESAQPPPLTLGVEPGIREVKADGDKPKWDVDNPPRLAEGGVVDLDVREGTWMSVDVSPDGQEIVFDLLGDLYTLPITGGEATPLTEGVSWDMQPRYSPDGRSIAFTSDRGGGDNIWVIDRQGKDPKPITQETFRLVNSPVWSPDGQWIAVRKHFTKRRSLGAGEIWLYHISGGKGLQMTEKQSDQKDVGEPAFSADGRYVYYSQDATPGATFEYNKDPHAGIYAIQRLDRQSGRIDRIAGGPGGAIRPTPSPDGRALAFIRRVGQETVLFVRDLASGTETPIYRGLDRDMQEAWAIHGVYPTIAWTRDGGSLVVWAGGALWRVDRQGRGATPIPFHVKSSRKVAKAVRRPIAVDADHVDTKMLRWVNVAPDGKSVVFQALGHLYIRPLPAGEPRRLTRDEGAFEMYPSFSRDGKSIVYTTWDDHDLGTIRTIAAKGGKSRVLSQEPGHYVEPVFTPDGKAIVYRKIRGGYTRTATWSEEPGIYALELSKGATPILVSRDGASPHFGADPARLFFVQDQSDKDRDKVVLQSVELDGSDPITHLSGEYVTDLRVAPDGRWVGFQEGFQAFIAPMPPTGRTVEIGAKGESHPITRVTRDAGDYLHWSGDSRRLHWSLGPEVFSRDLHEAFAFVDGAPEKLPEPAAKGTPIGLRVAAARPSDRKAIVGARIITMDGERVIDDGTVLVIGNKIAAVGPRAEVAVPADAFVIPGAGLTVIPGIIDVHAHGSMGEDGIIPQRNWLHLATLAFGVTTVHDPSNDTATIFAASELARAGLITAPRIFSTGTILYGARTSFTADVESLDDARRHLRRLQAVGAFSVKSYNQPRREQRQMILEAARELGMLVVPEGGSLFHHNMTMIVDGHTGIEHSLPVARAYADVTQLWGKTEVGHTPTLGVAYGGLGGENYWYAHTDVWKDPRLRALVPRAIYEPRARRRVLAGDGDWNHINAARFAKQLLDAGGRINLGAHGQREGLAAHWELWSFVQGGMTPMEALRAGTLHGAMYLGMDRELGSIEVGKLADLAIIDGNPLEDIRRSSEVRYTMINGHLHDARTMDELGPGGAKQAPFYWVADQVPAVDPPPAISQCHGHP